MKFPHPTSITTSITTSVKRVSLYTRKSYDNSSHLSHLTTCLLDRLIEIPRSALRSLYSYSNISGNKWEGGMVAQRTPKNASLGNPPHQIPVGRKWEGGSLPGRKPRTLDPYVSKKKRASYIPGAPSPPSPRLRAYGTSKYKLVGRGRLSAAADIKKVNVLTKETVLLPVSQWRT